MSELKGQLLGVILVITLFSMIAGSMKIIADRYVQAIDDNSTAAITEVSTTTTSDGN